MTALENFSAVIALGIGEQRENVRIGGAGLPAGGIQIGLVVLRVNVIFLSALFCCKLI